MQSLINSAPAPPEINCTSQNISASIKSHHAIFNSLQIQIANCHQSFFPCPPQALLDITLERQESDSQL